jgi:hypothetical protein
MTPIHPQRTLHHLARRRFGLLLPWGGLALLAACSKDPEPAAPAPAEPAPTPAPAPTAVAEPAATPQAMEAASGTAGTGLPMVDPADPSVQALAYHADASQVVAASNPKYQPGQACANCALFAGQPGADAGPCPLYPGRQVSAKGWCNAYAKKGG